MKNLTEALKACCYTKIRRNTGIKKEECYSYDIKEA
jgi:hypothetical protein